jgi:hypothetical protein
MEDTERLKQAASEVSPVSPVRRPEPAEMSGMKDRLAEDKSAGKS